jgi:hypothetical protein
LPVPVSTAALGSEKRDVFRGIHRHAAITVFVVIAAEDQDAIA